MNSQIIEAENCLRAEAYALSLEVFGASAAASSPPLQSVPHVSWSDFNAFRDIRQPDKLYSAPCHLFS